jgi:S-adenosylmethionine:tRNA ribosyltransferase-isomerase
MLVSDFDFHLPEELIAQRAASRGASRLLVVDDPRRHRRISELPELLSPGDLLVVNDTRVIPARLFARSASGGLLELLLVHRLDEAEWEVLAKPGRRARPGARFTLGVVEDGVASGGGPLPASSAGLPEESPSLEVVEQLASGRYRVRFSEPIEPHLERLGHVPLPPYIHRPDDAADRDAYQTVYARSPGAIAAPTAGLHFTPELLAAIEARGVRLAQVTLHVGIGTFKPVRATLVSDHHMDEEECVISEPAAEAIVQARAAGGRIVAVGTTVVRCLESSAKAHGGRVEPGRSQTDLFIYPGFDFQIVDRLLTNFHLPRSSLLMLVSAFAGRERVLAAYTEAIGEGYRFYSYGDAMLVRRAGTGEAACG